MGTVVISPNIKKESVRINPGGDIINARTKEVIEPAEPDFIPPIPVTPKVEPSIENKVGSKIDEMINKKIEELVAKKIEEALNKL